MQIKQSDDVRSPHVQLRTPSSVQDVENFLQLQFAIKLDVDSQNNQLLYYGDGTVRMKSYLQSTSILLVDEPIAYHIIPRSSHHNCLGAWCIGFQRPLWSRMIRSFVSGRVVEEASIAVFKRYSTGARLTWLADLALSNPYLHFCRLQRGCFRGIDGNNDLHTKPSAGLRTTTL